MKKYLLGVCFVMMSSVANASLIYNITAGQLTGIQNIAVDGTQYDVSFVEGRNDVLFGSTFDFPSYGESIKAMESLNAALVDDMVIDAIAYDFDTHPELIYGCENLFSCIISLPYTSSTLGNGSTGTQSVFLTNTTAVNDTVFNGSKFHYSDNNSLSYNDAVWSKWTLSTISATVPEPGSIALVFLGLFTLLFFRQRNLQA